MKLDAVTAELRPRGQWEAADFGVRMIRRDAGLIYRVWFVLTLPLFALGTAAILWLDGENWALMAYWWLEPMFDAPILYIISRRLFGEATTLRVALVKVPGLVRSNWIFLLTPMRLHFARSLAMPVVQLEGLRGRRRRERAKVLNSHTMNHGIGVTAAYQHLLLAICLGVVILVFAFIPQSYQDSLGSVWLNQFFEDEGAVPALLQLCVFYIGQSLLQPWFVGAGFGLYINRRTTLEAWDVEVAFRRMSQRRLARGAAGAAAAVLFAIAAVPAVIPAQAAELEPHWSEEEIDQAVKTIYARKDLQDSEVYETWERIDRFEEVAADREDESEFLQGMTSLFAFVFEFGLWIVLALIVIAIALSWRRWLPYLRPVSRPPRQRRRVILASGEVTAESLPDDLPAAVLALWREGRLREAVSLLYRGSVFGSVALHGVRIPDSATEGVCVDAVAAQAERTHADYFRRVADVWIWCAYGGRPPGDDLVASLCDEWPRHYKVPA